MQRQLLRHPEQTLLAVLVLLAIVAIFSYWLFRLWHQEDLIEFDKAPQLEVTFQVDINHADWPEIMQLPGIGETTARAIVKERQADGPYTGLGDLEERVHGVGPRMTAEIAPLIVPLKTVPDDAAVR